MLNQEILTKAIQKAIDGGWRFYGYQIPDYKNLDVVINGEQRDFSLKDVEFFEGRQRFRVNIQGLIFNHDFAKSLWGEDQDLPENYEAAYDFGQYESSPKWQHHLQQMVIADDPVKYLGEHLNNTNS